jgi:3-oxoadipate enol-lactonase
MPFMKKGEFKLYYEDTGGDLPAILFLHGAGGNHLSWWQQVPVFNKEYRCLTVDQRCFGKSPDVPNGPGIRSFADDALGLLDHLGIERVAMVTQSMGGWTAVGAAVKQPQRFWAIVLGNTVGNLTDPEAVALRRELLETRPPRPPILWQGALGKQFQETEPALTYLYAQISELNPPKDETFREKLYDVATPVEDFALSGVPTLFVTSDEDILIWPELSELIQPKIPGSRLVKIPGAGHSVYFERPGVFNREVGDFLKEYRPG